MNKKQLEAFIDELSEVIDELCTVHKKLTEKQFLTEITALKQYWLRAEAEEFKTINTLLSDLAVKLKQKYPHSWPVIRLVFIKSGINIK